MGYDLRRGHYLTYPIVPAVIVVRRGGDSLNALSVAWHTWVSFDPPLLAIAIGKERFSYGLIKENKEFTLNIIPLDRAHLYTLLGRTSGREIDKFKEFAIEVVDLDGFGTPRLKDAVAAFGCKVVGDMDAGDHTLFLGEVESAFVEKGIVTDEGFIDVERYTPSLYIGKNRYLKLGRFELIEMDIEHALKLHRGQSN